MGTNSQFVGTIPALYDRHLGPVIFETPALDLAARLDPDRNARVLEVACGTGIATRRLLDRLPAAARLMATDLNGAMLEHAGLRVESDARLEWRTADAQALPFPDGAFDAYVCQFGVMFFADKAAAMAEARRVLARGGQLLFNVWRGLDHNDFGRIAHETIAGFFNGDPPKFYQTPFGWSDEDVVRGTLERAGFGDVTLERVEFPTESESAESLAAGLVRGNPVALEIAERATADVAHIEAAVAVALTRAGGARPWRGTLRVLVVTAGA